MKSGNEPNDDLQHNDCSASALCIAMIQSYSDGKVEYRNRFNPLSLELMLRDRGDIAPVNFSIRQAVLKLNDPLITETKNCIDTQSNRYGFNLLSLELMLLDRGDITPVTFSSSHAELSDSDSMGFTLVNNIDTQLSQNASNRLSLELMLIGRGEISPTVFLNKEYAKETDCKVQWSQDHRFGQLRLSLELLLIGSGGKTPDRFYH